MFFNLSEQFEERKEVNHVLSKENQSSTISTISNDLFTENG
jgi:hypothetical protein